MTHDPIEGDPPAPGPRHHSQIQVRRPLLRSPWRLTAVVLSTLLGGYLLVMTVVAVVQHPWLLVLVAGGLWFWRQELAAVVRRRRWR